MNRSQRRPLKVILAERHMTLNDLVEVGIRSRIPLNEKLIQRWITTGILPSGGESDGLLVADALEILPEHLDYGPAKRGISEFGYRVMLSANGTARHGWNARIRGWGWPRNRPKGQASPKAVSRRLNDFTTSTTGGTANEALDTLEHEVRELIRTTPPNTQVAA